ncbi:oxidoreductase [Nocardia otitidiscaviarum]|uniref:Oxidoreductase n=1 Tax=Nocardia otitidiscaviarum TaxID=1823 RepID=A0A516NMT6_9NOCA|nr:aldo/keto reductase [Nocardia otitidiscaviarum]MCP9624543.1 aldo/keto reductase [Nocardia otitidiscaviarum]QDP80211.1 oxidoreductase [Nocardia otitidiscaviarum]
MSTFALGGDLRVNRIGFGTMRLAAPPEPGVDPGMGHIWRGPVDREAAFTVLRRAVELGANLIDTADSYALGETEELVAAALRPYREDVVVATKVGVVRPGPLEWVPLGHPAYLRQQAELSLRRLGLDRIDLLQLHRIDPGFPLAEQIGALKQLVDEGKVRHIGLSEASVAQLREAAAITPIASVQNLYNLGDRHHEDVVDYAAAQGIAFIPFFPVAMGAHAAPDGPVAAVATEIGATPAQTALAWLLRRSPTVLPIPGTTSLAHLEENLAAARVTLNDEQFERLSAVAPPVVAA